MLPRVERDRSISQRSKEEEARCVTGITEFVDLYSREARSTRACWFTCGQTPAPSIYSKRVGESARVASFRFSSEGRRIPCFFILAISVVRFIPNRAAAPYGPPTSHPVASNAPRIKRRSDSLSVLLVGNATTESTRVGRRRLGSKPSLESITARSITFWSSRTFPGHEYDSKALTNSSGMVSMHLPIRQEKIST